MRKIIVVLSVILFCFSCRSIDKFRDEYDRDLKYNRLGTITDLKPLKGEDVLTSLLVYYYIQSFKNQPVYNYGIPAFRTFPVIIAGDGTYLGELSYQFNANSILNSFGTYGNEFSSISIWNQFSSYGGEYSLYSPFNPYAISPPKIYWNGMFIGYLTTNSMFINRINPHRLINQKR